MIENRRLIFLHASPPMISIDTSVLGFTRESKAITHWVAMSSSYFPLNAEDSSEVPSWPQVIVYGHYNYSNTLLSKKLQSGTLLRLHGSAILRIRILAQKTY